MKCEACEFYGREQTEGVELESSRTMYHHPLVCTVHDDCRENEALGAACQATKPDPNRPLALCRECAVEHHANWDAMWSDYHASLM